MKLIKPKKIRKCDRKLIRYEYTVLFWNRELFYLFTTFGFWTSLLTPRYSQASFQSKIIKTCFKGVPAAQRNIKNLQARFDKIRILRNRVSHHERIIHWKNLITQHDELLESIKWLDNASYELACSCDKFLKVYAKDFKAYKRYVKRHWNRY